MRRDVDVLNNIWMSLSVGIEYALFEILVMNLLDLRRAS
jgi:hypothetical protein